MYNENQADIKRLNRQRFVSHGYEEDEGRKAIKNIFKMTRIQVDRSKNPARKKKKSKDKDALVLDSIKLNEGIFMEPESVDAASHQNDKPNTDLYSENLSDQEYDISVSSEESIEEDSSENLGALDQKPKDEEKMYRLVEIKIPATMIKMQGKSRQNWDFLIIALSIY